MAVQRTAKADIAKAENWEVVKYTKDGFTKSGNLNLYKLDCFAKVIPTPVPVMLVSYKMKLKHLLQQRESEIKQKDLRKDNEELINQLLKLCFGLVDNINTDLPMMGHDLERANNQLVSIVTRLKDAGIEP